MKTASAPPSETPARRLEEIARGRAGCFPITPTLIQAEPDFNGREDFGDLEALAADIEANGLQQPLKIRKEPGTENIYLIDGHRRWTAITTILIPQGRWPKDKTDESLPYPVECTSEKKFTKPVDRLFMQLSMNTGKPFTFLEEARLYQRILAASADLKPADIARRTGKTKQAISDSLQLVNNGSPLLLDSVKNGLLAASTALQIVKRVGSNPADQDALLEAATANANAAGREHIMPKDIPQPDPFAGMEFKLMKPSRNSALSIGSSENDREDLFCYVAILLHGLPSNQEVSIGWSWDEAGRWTVGYRFRNQPHKRTAYCLRKQGGAIFPDLKEALCNTLTIASTLLKWDPAMADEMEARMLKVIPAKEYRNANMPPETAEPTPPAADDSSSTENSELNTSNPAATPRFTLYIISDAPSEATAEGTFHETERLVLENPPAGIELLHLLSALDDQGEACYGYRYNKVTHLPDPNEDSSYGTHAEEGLKDALRRVAAFSSVFNPEATAIGDAIEDALHDALCRYYPESGNPEEPQQLAFVAIPQAEEKESGYQAIINAPTTNRDGSGPGSGGSGFVSPENGMKSVNKVLEDLDGKGIPERVTSVEIAMRICNGESTPSSLKDYLLGKS